MSKPKKSPAKKKRTKKSTIPAFRWRSYWLPAVILLVLPFALYAAALQFGYVLDDKLILSENNFVKKGVTGIADIFGNDSFTGYLGEQKDLVAGARYRPLSIASFALEHELYGLHPQRSHFINVLLYSLTGLLIFRLLFFLFPRSTKQQWWIGAPFLMAGLYLLHPIHTEVVANIKGRDEIMVLLLSLATLYYSFRYAKQAQWWQLGASGVLFLLALFAKENAVTFLGVIPLSLYLFSKADIKRIAMATAPLLVGFVLYLMIRIDAIGYLFNPDLVVSGIMNDPFIGTTFAEKYATITYTLGQYLKLLVFPHPLTHDYYPYQVPILNWGDWRVLLSLVLNLALVVWVFRSWGKRSIISWSILFYFFTLSIVSNIVFSVGAPMNERFMYVSSLGFVVLVVYLLRDRLPNWLPQVKQLPMVSLGIIGLMAVGYAYKTIDRVPAWENEMTLNQAAIKVSTNSARANSYMAYSLYQRALQESGAQQMATVQEALPFVNRALEIYPEYSDAVTCKSGLVAAIYQQDNDLGKLLDEFYPLMAAKHVAFHQQYMEYLNGRGDQGLLLDFYHRVGYELFGLQKQDYALARQYINYGLGIDPANAQLQQDLADINQRAGN